MRNALKLFAAAVGRVFEYADPIVEIGSLQTPEQGKNADLRPLFVGHEYIGCDIVEGPGVDRIDDVRALRFADGAVGMVLAMDSLEHVADPAVAVAEMHRVTAPRGLVVIGVPFIFPIHHHPDFHRFTPEGLDRLLGRFTHVATFAIGDAQAPHTVTAVAANAGTETEFEERMSAVIRAWEASGVTEPIARFRPVESTRRCADLKGGAVVLEPGAPYEEVLICPRNGLCRVDVLLAITANDARPARVSLSLASEDGETDAARADVRGTVLGAAQWITFPMPVQENSAQRAYRVRIEAVGGKATAFRVPEGGIMIDLFVARPAVPLMEVESRADGDPSAMRLRNAALMGEVRRLEQEVRALQASLARPWWVRLFHRRAPAE